MHRHRPRHHHHHPRRPLAQQRDLTRPGLRGSARLGALALLVALFFALGGVGGARPAAADEIGLSVETSHPLVQPDRERTLYLRVGLTGFKLSSAAERPPVNVAIVLDRSGSMQGQKLEHAKRAAIEALEMLGPRDIVSVIVYDHTVRVLVPATKLTDKPAVARAIQSIDAGGNTALFAGVAKGALEVRKFLEANQVNRVILLSDGQANVGPSTPSELGDLGGSLIKEGVSVSTLGLGLGYNEDLMRALARRSDGNHAFIEDPRDLARVFRYEFGDATSVVAQRVRVRIRCREGLSPVRVLGREATITGPTVAVSLNQLYSQQEKYVLLEVRLPAGAAGRSRRVAEVSVTYDNMVTKSEDRLAATTSVRYVDAAAEAAEAENKKVMINVVEQLGAERNRLAIALRDEGKMEEAAEAFERNEAYFRDNAERYDSKKLKVIHKRQMRIKRDAASGDSMDWSRSRKEALDMEQEVEAQQAW